MAIRFKLSFLFIFIAYLPFNLQAQKSHFIYIETENKQPFFIKMDEEILSSSVYGYIILPNLSDSSYSLSIGFPKNEWPEQNISVTVKEADAGFILKNFGAKGWGLFNLQNAQIIMPDKKVDDKKAVEIELIADTFSTILAAVVNDPTIAQRVVVKNGQLPAEKSPETKTGITKIKYDVTAEGAGMTYLDIVNGVTDTIEMVFSAVRSETSKGPKTEISKSQSTQKKDEPKKKDSKFIDMELQNPNQQPDSNKTPQLILTEKKEKVTGVNSNCKNFASRDDFLNLRKQMVTIESYDDMINTARKKFKNNCFTTEQIKNLGSLFLKDEGKYKFYYAAYPYVSDLNNFNTLENQLTDKNFITKFRAILQY